MSSHFLLSMSVDRIFDVDFIYFDLFLVSIWILLFIKSKHYTAICMGLLAFVIYFMVDFGIWYSLLGTRHISAPISEWLFLLYFSFTYGMIQFGYVAVILTPKSNKIAWTLLLYVGWILMAFLSNEIAWDDRVISISREMENGRWIQVIMTIVGLLLVYVASRYIRFFRNIKWYIVIPILFGLGMIVHIALELPLIIAGIRPFYWDDFLWNAFIEFNSGTGIMYFMFCSIYLLLMRHHLSPNISLTSIKEYVACTSILPQSICNPHIPNEKICKNIGGIWEQNKCNVKKKNKKIF